MKRRLSIAIACVIACIAGVSAASALTERASQDHDLPDRGRPETAQQGARSPDPVAGPDWIVRTHATEGDRLCVELGRGHGSEFGRAIDNDTVVERAPNGHGVCRPSSKSEEHVAIAQFGRSGEQGPRTVVFGRVLTADAQVRVTHEGSERAVPVDEDGTFVLPLSGLINHLDLPVEITRGDGEVRRLDWR